MADGIESLKDKAIDKVKERLRLIVEDMESDGYHMMSGTLSQRTITSMGHPYARQSWFPINVQTGTLRHSWKQTGGGLSYTLSFDEMEARYARYVIKGTRKMKARDVLEELKNSFTTRVDKFKE